MNGLPAYHRRPGRPARLATAGVAAAALLVLAACSGTAGDASATGATPSGPASASSPSSDAERLVVADPAAAAVHAYSVPEHELLGTIEDVAVADHPGFVQLEDGRLLAASTEPPELVALDVTGRAPEVVGRVDLPGAAVHIAVDPQAGLAAVSTSAPSEDGDAGITVVDLASFEVRSALEVTSEEPGIAFVEDGLLHRDGAEDGRVELLPLDRVLAGESEPAATAPAGAYGHGEAVVDGQLLLATDAGLERFRVTGDTLTAGATVPWAADGGDWGRGYYLRTVGREQPHVWSYVRDQSSPSWAQWRNDVYVLPAGADVARRAPLGNGLAFRFAVADDRVLFARMHPDGYVAHVVDADPASPTFMTTLHHVALPVPTGAPAPDDDVDAVWASPGRPIAALTGDGEVGYVSRGGDGVIDVVDTDAGTVTGTIEVPTPLDGGGYLVTARPGVEPVDRLGR
ncbi:hypothetical protein GC089_09465 [Cellulomonas sp. JZ18]|uniref:hypothetical protein n=1 Tax=Cellulomonas sp. JZ18 TaxID=2654191 RepID=UPI0012D486A1|nr:hypothetical protein [Cellulomonas sp. JZ18]QGQ19412.1 hypothetical protein GC089_09465 [Cellulomonas sp. JZ18]